MLGFIEVQSWLKSGLSLYAILIHIYRMSQNVFSRKNCLYDFVFNLICFQKQYIVKHIRFSGQVVRVSFPVYGHIGEHSKNRVSLFFQFFYSLPTSWQKLRKIYRFLGMSTLRALNKYLFTVQMAKTKIKSDKYFRIY